MIKKSLIAATAIAALLAAVPAQALTLINDDDATYEVTVVAGQGDGANDTFNLESGDERADICESGCTIILNNGAEKVFQGGETILIQDGNFVSAD